MNFKCNPLSGHSFRNYFESEDPNEVNFIFSQIALPFSEKILVRGNIFCVFLSTTRNAEKLIQKARLKYRELNKETNNVIKE